jgi:iron complex transport system permease protein
MQSDMLFWTVGGLGRADWPAVAMLAAGVVPAGIAAAALAPSLTVLLLGDDAAAGLGQRVVRVRRLAVAVIVLAAGAATAVAGPVAFVGLMAPHAARALLGHDQRLVLPAAALVGAGAVLAADVVGRVAAPPAEVPLGVFASLVGAPLLVALVAQRRRAGALA